MTKLKLSQLVTSAEALRNLTNTKLPIKISYQLSRLVSEFDTEMKTYDEKRRELITELGTKNLETGETSIDPNNKEVADKFYSEMGKLMDVEVDLKFAEKIKIADLGDIKIEATSLPEWLFSSEE